MLKRNRLRRAVGFLTGATAVVALSVLPAEATEHMYKALTCNGSTTYSTIIYGDARGQVTHWLEGTSFSQYKGASSTFVWRTSNTHIAGTHRAWISAWDYLTGSGAVVIGDVGHNSSLCGTY